MHPPALNVLQDRCCKPTFRCSFLLLLFSALATLGCGSKSGGPQNSVSGKVALNGQPVAGEVVFAGPGKKEVKTVIGLDGYYFVTDPPVGENNITIRRVGGMAPPKDASKMPGAPSPVPSPPAKYARPGNGLKFNYTVGTQTYVIDLIP